MVKIISDSNYFLLSKKPTIRNLLILIIILGCLSFAGCGGKKVVIENYPPKAVNAIDHKDTVLKAHMKNGELIILSKWDVDVAQTNVTGYGMKMDINRKTINHGPQIIWIDSVALFESNTLMPASGVGALTIMTGLSLGITVYCATNPKACFGSCPTFYFEDKGKSYLVAEGFSASVAPSLEASDLDALYHAYPTDNKFSLTMTNEALETHVIRRVELMAVPIQPGTRIVSDDDGNFWTVRNITPPVLCESITGDILPLINSFDSKEYYSTTDSLDLGTSEEILFEVEPSKANHKGIILAFRQTLLTTYLFYQTLGYMGSQAGEYLSALERGNKEALSMAHSLGDELGGIEILVKTSDEQWVVIDEVYETGPIATDMKIISIPLEFQMATHYKIRMARGNWRLDYLAMAEIMSQTEALAIKPDMILVDGIKNDSLLKLFNDPELQVVTLPGDRMELQFSLPESDQSWELFLDSQGYYLEWMREEWIAEENPIMLAQMLLDPKTAMLILAPQYKEIEANMEELFWNSKYVK